jgi:hypothetical protein
MWATIPYLVPHLDSLGSNTLLKTLFAKRHPKTYERSMSKDHVEDRFEKGDRLDRTISDAWIVRFLTRLHLERERSRRIESRRFVVPHQGLHTLHEFDAYCCDADPRTAQ